MVGWFGLSFFCQSVEVCTVVCRVAPNGKSIGEVRAFEELVCLQTKVDFFLVGVSCYLNSGSCARRVLCSAASTKPTQYFGAYGWAFNACIERMNHTICKWNCLRITKCQRIFGSAFVYSIHEIFC